MGGDVLGPHGDRTYTIYDMDNVLPDVSYYAIPSTYRECRPKYMHLVGATTNTRRVEYIQRAKSERMYNQHLLHVRRQILEATMNQYLKWSLQIRATYRLKVPLNIVKGTIPMYSDMGG